MLTQPLLDKLVQLHLPSFREGLLEQLGHRSLFSDKHFGWRQLVAHRAPGDLLQILADA
jgi:hypothetical protein